MKNKVILTDVDGCLLDWEEGFGVWMEYQGRSPVPDHKDWYGMDQRFGLDRQEIGPLIREFNQSAAIGFLPPLRDAQSGVHTLTGMGYRFIAVTSLSLDPYAKKLRWRNLKKLFGDDTFLDLHCLDTGACKRDILRDLSRHYQGNVWIEDKIENLEAGIQAGFQGILFEHKFNMHYQGSALVAKSWSDIVTLLA